MPQQAKTKSRIGSERFDELAAIRSPGARGAPGRGGARIRQARNAVIDVASLSQAGRLAPGSIDSPWRSARCLRASHAICQAQFHPVVRPRRLRIIGRSGPCWPEGGGRSGGRSWRSTRSPWSGASSASNGTSWKLPATWSGVRGGGNANRCIPHARGGEQQETLRVGGLAVASLILASNVGGR